VINNSEDFKIGQTVSCAEPEGFLQPLRDYLKGRTGVVKRIFPKERPDKNYCGHVNQVEILWGKRNGRGKEKLIRMHPRDLRLEGEQP